MLKETMILTTDIYEGYHEKDQVWWTGDYQSLMDEPGIDNDTIQPSEGGWSDESAYFMEFMKKALENFEKKQRRKVRMLALVGQVGTWQGSRTGGKLFHTDMNPLTEMGSVDSVEVYLSDEGIIELRGHHHDGTHRMKLYVVTAKEYSSLMKEYGGDGDPDLYKYLDEKGTLLLSDYAEGYFTKPEVTLEDAGVFW